MLREIIFRGKTLDRKWVQGDLLQIADGRKYIVNNKFGACIDDKGNFINTEAPFVCEVIPETIGQYTGLTDKNGTKIFEGDIVKCTDTQYDYEFIAVVLFGNPNGEYNWGFQLKRVSGASANTDILLWVEMEDTGALIEVIGNIHDNPELLKGGAE